MYGFCKDAAGSVFTSCYRPAPAASLATVTTVSGIYTAAANQERCCILMNLAENERLQNKAPIY